MSHQWQRLLGQAILRQERAVERYRRWSQAAVTPRLARVLTEIAQVEAEHLEFLRHVAAGDWRSYLNRKPGSFQPLPARSREPLIWRLPAADL